MKDSKLFSYWQFVEHWSSVDPDFPSLREGERRISAREFQETTDRLAEGFLSLGVKKRDRILTILPNGIDYVFALIAAGKVGAITVPLDVKFRTADLKRFLSHAQPRVIVSITQADDFDIAACLRELTSDFGDTKIVLSGSKEFGFEYEEMFSARPNLVKELDTAKQNQSKDDGALVIFTGGTTGKPKAALLSHWNMTLMSQIDFQHLFNSFSENERPKILAPLPPSHVGGTVEFVGSSIVGGGEMILMDLWSPRRVLEITQEERISFIGGVPTMFAIMLAMPDLDEFDLSSVRLAVCSGEKVPLELLKGIKTRIAPAVISGYGSTEGGAEVTMTTPDDDPQIIAQGYTGKLLPTVELKIVDDDENPLPAGQVGEILISGPLAIKSYYNMPEEDKAGFTADGWVKSGDLGYLTEDGGLYVVGRKKHIIRVGSYTVMPSEVEEVVLKFPEVAMAAVIGVPDDIYMEQIWLVVTPEPGYTIDEEEIIARCQQELAKFKVPKKVLVRENIPTTRIGKADRLALTKEILAASER